MALHLWKASCLVPLRMAKLLCHGKDQGFWGCTAHMWQACTGHMRCKVCMARCLLTQQCYKVHSLDNAV